MTRITLAIGGLLGAFLMMGNCFYIIGERPTVVSVKTGPSFAMNGSGQLAIFTVYSPKVGNRIAYPHKDDSSIVWQIVAKNGYFEGAQVGGLELNYGKVPNGYAQLVPSESQPAPTLLAGAVYSFFAETTNAPVASGYFYVDPKGPIQTYIPDLCLTRKDGREVRVKCGFVGDRTYREPTNLEDEVHKNQVTNTAAAKTSAESELCEPKANGPK